MIRNFLKTLILSLVINGCYQENVLEQPASPNISLLGFEYIQNQGNDPIDSVYIFLEIFDAQNDFGIESFENLDPFNDNSNLIIDVFDENNVKINFADNQSYNALLLDPKTNPYLIVFNQRNIDITENPFLNFIQYNFNEFKSDIIFTFEIFRGASFGGLEENKKY